MHAATYPIGRFLTFAGLSLADLVLTWTLLQLTGGTVYETNPIANAWLAHYGWTGLILFKSLTVLIFTTTSLLVFYHRPTKAAHMMNIGCFVLGAVVLYSLVLLRTYT